MSVIWRDAPTQSIGLKCAPQVSDKVKARISAVPVVRYHRFKRWLDRLAAAILLVPGVPLMVVLIAVVRLTSKGPGIYSQVRVGRGGRSYTMYKLRSMRSDAEAGSGPTWSTGEDPRITKIGKILRKLHLDELPQLFNVLKGDMSLIGPRPERPEFVEVLATEIPEYVERLAVDPGVTGLAQINLPADVDLDSVRRKLVLDREYIQDASLWLDLRIVMCTLLRLVGLSGQKAMQWTGVRRTVELPVAAPPASPPHRASASESPALAAPCKESATDGIPIKPVSPRESAPVPVSKLLRKKRKTQDGHGGSGIWRERSSEDSDSGIHGTLSTT